MPYRFEFDARHGLLAVRCSGKIADDVLTGFLKEMILYAQRYPVQAALVDFAAVTGVDLTSGIVQHLAALPDPIPDPTPRVIIAPSDLVFGLSRMYKGLAAEKREALHIVRTEQAALDHLSIRGELQFVPLPSPDLLS